MSTPDDLILNAADEVAIRQNLLLVALGKRPADRIVEVGRLLAVHAGKWLDNQEIVIAGRRIAYVGPRGSWRGEAAERICLSASVGRAGLRRGAQAHRIHRT